MVPHNNTPGDSGLLSCAAPLLWISIMVVANLLSTFLGIFGNILVLIAVRRTHSLRSIINYYMVSLALADLIVTLLVQPLMVVVLLGQFFGYLECESALDVSYRVLGSFSCAAAFLNLCFLSFERFLAVLRPLSTYQTTQKKRFAFLLVVSWLLPLIYALVRVTVSRKVTSYLSGSLFLVGYLWMIVCYATILVCLRLQARRADGVTDQRQRKTERKITVTMILVVVSFTVMWLPFFYVLLSGHSSWSQGYMYEFIITLALCHSCCNPIIYSFRNTKYRKAFAAILCAGHASLRRSRQHTRSPLTNGKLCSGSRKQSVIQTHSFSALGLTPPSERRKYVFQDTEKEINE